MGNRKNSSEKASKFFCESLKMAWEEYKNTELVGSEKQVAWAKKSKKNVLFQFAEQKTSWRLA